MEDASRDDDEQQKDSSSMSVSSSALDSKDDNDDDDDDDDSDDEDVGAQRFLDNYFFGFYFCDFLFFPFPDNLKLAVTFAQAGFSSSE